MLAAGLLTGTARGGDPDGQGAPPPDAVVSSAEAGEPGWAFSASLYAYLVPEEEHYLQPTFSVDRDWLHLEARYNYEGMETGSAWVGYNLAVGDAVTLEITPMLGAVFGDATGIAPGYRGSLAWWRLELYSEGEYVVDTGERSDSYFYNWSQLTLSPVDWFKIGLVTQRTRVYESDLEIQRGFLVGLSVRSVEITAHVFNPDEDEPTFVFSFAVEF